MDYLAAIESYFVKSRGSGFSFSARDVDLAMRWEASGIPVEVVLRAMRDFDLRAHANDPRTLGAYARGVARAFALAKQLRVGANQESES